MEIADNVLLLEGGQIEKLDNHYTGHNEVLKVLRKGIVKISYKRKPTII